MDEQIKIFKKMDLLISFVIGFVVAVILRTIFVLQNIQLTYKQITIQNWQIIVVLPILSLLGFIIASLLARKIKIFFQIAKFVLVGLLNTSLDFGVLNVLIYVFKVYSGIGIVAINTTSFIVAVINSYFWNKYWTFGVSQMGADKTQMDADNQYKYAPIEFLQFLVISILGLLINDGIVYVITTFIPPLAGLTPVLWANVAKLSAILVQLIWNFLGYKLIVFKKSV